MSLRRIIYIVNSYPYGDGEITFVEPELRRLSKQYEITLVTLAKKADFRPERMKGNVPPGIDVVWCGKSHAARRLLSILQFYFTRLGREEARLIIRSKESVLPRLAVAALYYGIAQDMRCEFERNGLFDETEDTLFYTYWLGRQAAALSLQKLANPRLLLMSRVHGYDLYQERAPFGWQSLQTFKARMCDAIVFHSQQTKAYFESVFDAADQGSHPVVPLGSPDRGTGPVPHEDGRYTVVSCSNLIPLKRVDLIVKALSKISTAGVRWIHFGDGPLSQELRESAENLGLDFDMKGQVDNNEILEFYRTQAVDAFITTSSTEGLPVSIQEAMSFGIPIIATDVGSISETIDGNGILLGANPTIDDVAHALDKVLTAPERGKAMRMRSRQVWEELFDQKTRLDELEHIIDELFEIRSDEGQTDEH